MNFWDYEIWADLLQFGYLAVILLIANTLVRKVKPLRRSLLPIAVIGGFLALILKLTGVTDSFLKADFLNSITYHAIMIGFIALGLKVKKEGVKSTVPAIDSGIFIVSNYVLQAIIGIGLCFILIPSFAGSGVLLAMGFGQGPGQANNIGMQYEQLGFVGGQSFGLSIASLGFIWACVMGIIFLNILAKKGIIKKHDDRGDVTAEVDSMMVEDKGEIPVSHAIDKLTVQVSLVLLTTVLAYGAMYGITFVAETFVGGNFVANTVKPLVWGFNFIFGTVMALLVSVVMKGLKKTKLMKRQYQNNYMLNRIAGLAFDFMIIASITAIDISALKSLILPLLIITTVGGIATFFYDRFMCKIIYPTYQNEATLAFYGMMTGTVSSGMILLREIDPAFKTPTSDALVIGSSTAIVFALPFLLLVSMAPNNPVLVFFLALAGMVVCVLVLLRRLIFKRKGKISSTEQAQEAEQPKQE